MKSLLDLEPCDCRYIEGEPDGLNTRYCGSRIRVGSSYCPEHHAACFTKEHKPAKRPRKSTFTFQSVMAK